MDASVQRAIDEISAAIHSSDIFDPADSHDKEKIAEVDAMIDQLDRWIGALQAKKLFFHDTCHICGGPSH